MIFDARNIDMDDVFEHEFGAEDEDEEGLYEDYDEDDEDVVQSMDDLIGELDQDLYGAELEEEYGSMYGRSVTYIGAPARVNVEGVGKSFEDAMKAAFVTTGSDAEYREIGNTLNKLLAPNGSYFWPVATAEDTGPNELQKDFLRRVVFAEMYGETVEFDDAIYNKWKSYEPVPSNASLTKKGAHMARRLTGSMVAGIKPLIIDCAERLYAWLPGTDAQMYNTAAMGIMVADKLFELYRSGRLATLLPGGALDELVLKGDVFQMALTEMGKASDILPNMGKKVEVTMGSTMVYEHEPVPGPAPSHPPMHTIPVAPRSTPFFTPPVILTIGVGLMLLTAD